VGHIGAAELKAWNIEPLDLVLQCAVYRLINGVLKLSPTAPELAGCHAGGNVIGYKGGFRGGATAEDNLDALSFFYQGPEFIEALNLNLH